MKTKHLGVVTACVLALTVGTANATIYNIEGGDLPLTSTVCPPGKTQPVCDNISASYPVHFAGPILGTIEIDNGAVTNADVMIGYLPYAAYYTVRYVRDFQFTSPDVWSVYLSSTIGDDNLWLTDSNGIISAAKFVEADDNPAYPVVTFAGTNVGTITTPLPAALPLFASGLAGLGLVG